MIYNEICSRGTADFPVAYYYLDKNHTRYEMSAHWHNEIELIRVISGNLSVKLNTKTYEASPGDVFFVNSQTVHSAVPSDCTYECIVMHLDFFKTETETCKHFIESLYNQEYVINEYSCDKDSSFSKTLNAFFDAMKTDCEGKNVIALGALYTFLGDVILKHRYDAVSHGKSAVNDTNVPKLKHVLSFIRENYAEPITLSDMASVIGMSPKYFCYFFKNMTGNTPNQYLNSYRIERAAQKLLSTDLSVTEVAYSTGFNDLSYFIKTFKSVKNLSPRKYRTQ